jgi:hypothetical protein
MQLLQDDAAALLHAVVNKNLGLAASRDVKAICLFDMH